MLTRRSWIKLGAACGGTLAVAGAGYGWMATQVDDATTIAIMVAAAEAVIGIPVERSHYERYFEWRLRELPKSAAEYRHAAEVLERSARAELGSSFVKASLPGRLRLCDESLDIRLRREMLELFANTDAWVALGFAGWPGMARGFDAYRKRPG
jgi:hypothetical protein